MRKPAALPSDLSKTFSVQQALDAGVSLGRLRRTDLDAPFHGVRTPHPPDRTVAVTADHPSADVDPFERQARGRRQRARQYAPRLSPGQFLSHESAVALFGGPLPLITHDGTAIDGKLLPVHVSTNGAGPLVRATGVVGHRSAPSTTHIVRRESIVLASPETAFAQLGSWNVEDLVALGDFLCRVWRPGFGRPDAGNPPFATLDSLRAAVAAQRRVGARKLREALDLIREDSWSARESQLRVRIVRAGLPEPLLNHDVYDDHGRFLGCVDLAYPHQKVAIEYQSRLHSARYAADVERLAALRAAGWTVIEVTSELFARPRELIERIRRALSR